MVHFGEFLKTWSLRSNSVTRQVIFNRTKIGGKCQNWKFKCDILGDFQTLWALLFFASLLFLVPFIFYFCHNFTTSIFLKCCWRRWLKWRPYFTLITDLADKRRFVFSLLFYDTLLFEQKPNMMRKDLIQFSLHSIFMRTLLNDVILQCANLQKSLINIYTFSKASKRP